DVADLLAFSRKAGHGLGQRGPGSRQGDQAQRGGATRKTVHSTGHSGTRRRRGARGAIVAAGARLGNRGPGPRQTRFSTSIRGDRRPECALDRLDDAWILRRCAALPRADYLAVAPDQVLVE